MAEDGTVLQDAILITYTFTGTYTQDGDTVVLAFPHCLRLVRELGQPG